MVVDCSVQYNVYVKVRNEIPAIHVVSINGKPPGKRKLQFAKIRQGRKTSKVVFDFG